MLCSIVALAPAMAKPTAIERRLTHPNGASLTMKSIEFKPDSIVLSVAITNPGDRVISLNHDRGFVLTDGGRGVHHLNPPADNPELRIAAWAETTGDLVFIGPLAPSARTLSLSSNEGIGTRDNPYDDAPVFTASLPVAAGDSARLQADHPDGVSLVARGITMADGRCTAALLATNGNERAVKLNANNGLVFAAAGGQVLVSEAPAGNPELTLPPANRLDAEIGFACPAVQDGAILTLTTNRDGGGTIDNPYDTVPVLSLKVPVEHGAVGTGSRASVGPIAKSRLVTGAAVAEAAQPVPAPEAKPQSEAPPQAASTPKPGQPEAPPRSAVSPPKPAPKPEAAPAPPQVNSEMQATRTDRGLRIVLPADELFGASGDAFAPTADRALAGLARLLAASRPQDVDISGHTDSVGQRRRQSEIVGATRPGGRGLAQRARREAAAAHHRKRLWPDPAGRAKPQRRRLRQPGRAGGKPADRNPGAALTISSRTAGRRHRRAPAGCSRDR